MRAVVISDSHGDNASINMLLNLQRKAELVVFLGDGENDLLTLENSLLLMNRTVVAVKGNCDLASTLPTQEVFTFGGKKILAVHGHLLNVKYTDEMLSKLAEELSCDIALYGHTHSEETHYENGIHIMCPGSIHSGSYGIIDIDDKTGTVLCYTAKL